MRKLNFLALLGSAVVMSTAWGAAPSPNFPRLGGYLIGSPQDYEDPTYQAQVARLNFAIINTWPGWKGWTNNGTTPQQAAAAIKAINPSILLYQYVIVDSLGQGLGTTGAYTVPYNKLQASQWWLYQPGGLTQVLSSWQGGNGPFYETNITNFVTPDSNGDRYNTWYAKWAVSTFLTPAPALDGLYTDDMGWKPGIASTGNWNLAGSAADAATVQQWYRTGYQTYLAQLASSAPGKGQLGNLSDWGDPNGNLSGLSGNVIGGVMEGIVGLSWSVETWSTWQATLNWYRKTMANVAAPQLVIFHQLGNPADYQSMRYGLATCLMDNGYYEFVSDVTSSSGDYHTIYWFDEFNANLGQATTSPPTAAWQKGVYRRDFQNGIALVNPKGNGAQTVTLEASFTRLSGSQVPAVNSGQAVTTLTLQDRDGIILLRAAPVKVPKPPGALHIAP